MVKINGAVEKACQTKITADTEVETLEKESEHRILVKGTERAVTFSPELEILDIEIPPCTVGENSSDWTRLCEAINSRRKKDIIFQPKTGNTACNQPTDKRKKMEKQERLSAGTRSWI